MATGRADSDAPPRRRWAGVGGTLLAVALALAVRYESWEWRTADGQLLGWQQEVRFVGWSPPPAEVAGPVVAEVRVRRDALLGLHRVRYAGPPPARLPD